MKYIDKIYEKNCVSGGKKIKQFVPQNSIHVVFRNRRSVIDMSVKHWGLAAGAVEEGGGEGGEEEGPHALPKPRVVPGTRLLPVAEGKGWCVGRSRFPPQST